MTDKSWKAFERKVAKITGGRRIPASGSAQFEGELGDVFHKSFEIECKWRSKLQIASWFREVRERANRSGKIPLLVVHEKGMQSANLAVLRLEDLYRLMGDKGYAKKKEEEQTDSLQV